jgi:hypothetical protein
MHSGSTAGGARLRLVAGVVPARDTQEGVMPRLRLINPQAARTRIAPVDGGKVPAPQAARMRDPLRAAGRRPGVVASPRIFGPVLGNRIPAPTAGMKFPAPTAGHRGPAPTAGIRGPAPTAGFKRPAPANVAVAA